ncbi:hypothetical protein [Akkermansia sp.]|uniref:hypothetical protein n=1 Tax=Akkermansia sp. TaxID=1872421 RepID=UPI0029119352|nr:hypothetical protein [Akkermansia sp.]MDU7625898.1 hypothetical protein [Akkermansia sp.]
MISRRAKTAERRPEKTQIQHQARKNPQAPHRGSRMRAASSPASLPARAGMIQKPMLYISTSPSGKTTGHGEETSS